MFSFRFLNIIWRVTELTFIFTLTQLPYSMQTNYVNHIACAAIGAAQTTNN